MALSSNQKHQRKGSGDKPYSLTGFEANEHHHIIRQAAKVDLDRVAELWANLAMVQSMADGGSVWKEACDEAKLEWAEYISKLVSANDADVLVFEDNKAIYGFAYYLSEVHQKAKKAVFKEIYLEPIIKSEIDSKLLAKLLNNSIEELGFKFIQFDTDI